MRLGLLLVSIVFLLPAAARAADTSDPVAAGKPKASASSYASVSRQTTGQRCLLIDYPWQVYAKPSVEVRVVTDDKATTAVPHPLFFAAGLMKGDIEVAISKCLQAAYDTGLSQRITADKLEAEILGRRNSLGKPSVCVASKEKTKAGAAAPSAWAAFCLLDCWAMNRHSLCLDLPREYFAKPGKLQVWFLRGDVVLWEEQLDWPGY
jgi:hypothetical protein